MAAHCKIYSNHIITPSITLPKYPGLAFPIPSLFKVIVIKKIKPILIFILLSYSILFSTEENYLVEAITTADGLANSCIQYILQDSDGFMWFATEGGLNRYDGYEIKHYPSLPLHRLCAAVHDCGLVRSRDLDLHRRHRR